MRMAKEKSAEHQISLPRSEDLAILFRGAGRLDERVKQALDDTSGELREILLDLCAWVAYSQKRNDIWGSLGRNLPVQSVETPEIPQAAKRKAGLDTNLTRKKAKPGSKPIEEVRFENQYLQGRSITHPALHGTGCGYCKLIAGDLKFVSPMNGDMHLEVSNGVLFSESHADAISRQKFLLYFPHIEAVFVRPNLQKSAPKNEAIQFIIIPTAMIGASSTRRDLPLPVIFNTPKTKPTGKITEFGDADSVALLIENVLRNELESFNTTIQHLLGPNQKHGDSHAIEASWNVSSQFTGSATAREQQPQGLMYLINTGLLFIAKESYKTIYCPWHSINLLSILVIKDMASGKQRGGGRKKQKQGKGIKNAKSVEINLIIEATEPWYDEQDANESNDQDIKNETHQVTFSGILIDRLQNLKDYSETHKATGKLKYKLCEMVFYDYYAGKPASEIEDVQED